MYDHDVIDPKEAPAYRTVASEIERLVTEGALQPGDPLPSEADLAERFGVNRSTVRESLRLLEDTGYVVRVSPRKLVAALPSARSLAERTTRALLANKVTLRDVWQVNRTVEPELARLAADRASVDDLAALRRNVDETRGRVDAGKDVTALDQEFHDLLAAASHQQALLFAIEPFKQLFIPVVDGLVKRLEVGERLATAHERIFEAIERGDANIAALWSRRHADDFGRGCMVAGVDIDVPFKVGVLDKSAS